MKFLAKNKTVRVVVNRLVVLGCSLTLVACAVGNQYKYHETNIVLPLKGSGVLLLDVHDQRPEIVSGDKDASFVGLQRGGFGNPFNVTTASGNALTDDIEVALENALRNSGYTVRTVSIQEALSDSDLDVFSDAEERLLVLRVGAWKTDIYSSMGLDYDLRLTVYDAQGNQLANSTLKADAEAVGGSGVGEKKNSQAATAALAEKLGYLFNESSIKKALND